MQQTTLNILMIFVAPAAVGILLRAVFCKWRKGYFVTVFLAAAVAASALAVLLVNTHGDEGLGILALMTATAFAGSLAAGIVIQLLTRLLKPENHGKTTKNEKSEKPENS